MPYRIDGLVHHNGVRVEHVMAALFQTSPPLALSSAYPGIPLQFIQKGGTQVVDDIVVLSGSDKVTGISVKNHSSTGTFDYINTSTVSDYIPSAEKLLTKISELRETNYRNEESIPHVRKELESTINDTWTSLTSESVRSVLKKINERNSEWICVKSSTDYSLFRHDLLDELTLYPYDESVVYELRAPRDAKTSRQIWRVKDGIATNTHIRMRIALNNGVGALLGLSEANSNSVLTIKLQQDNVDSLLKKVAP